MTEKAQTHYILRLVWRVEVTDCIVQARGYAGGWLGKLESICLQVFASVIPNECPESSIMPSAGLGAADTSFICCCFTP